MRGVLVAGGAPERSVRQWTGGGLLAGKEDGEKEKELEQAAKSNPGEARFGFWFYKQSSQ